MNPHLQSIHDLIKQYDFYQADDKNELISRIKKLDREFSMVEFKLTRTERVKRTTEILLKETISELEQKRKDIEAANAVLEKSLNDLKSAQDQLIQSEKMASLGELIAGIAHEIQNPLNFVNNFSEVNKELISELKEELVKGDLEESKVIADDIAGNEDKIHHHGNRASGIVKGMLEHSRKSTGEKVRVDINAMADEYLKLAYHGLRAKDSHFQSDFKTDFDKNLPNVNVVSQDIGRVLLNLINNGFQAIHERFSVAEVVTEQGGGRSRRSVLEAKPELVVSTKKLKDSIEIVIKDNGGGIADEIKDKIFQPFFTTKPTGQGTGLGLSLAYDIVKAHGGKLNVMSEISIGTKFVILLPIG